MALAWSSIDRCAVLPEATDPCEIAVETEAVSLVVAVDSDVAGIVPLVCVAATSSASTVLATPAELLLAEADIVVVRPIPNRPPIAEIAATNHLVPAL